MPNHSNKTEKTCIRIIFIIFILLNILPLIFASAYSTFVADDFRRNGLEGIPLLSNFPTYIRSSWDYMKNYYLGWGGIYFASFIGNILSSFKNIRPYYWLMVFNSALICLSLLYFMLVYWRYLRSVKQANYWLPLFMSACVIYMFVNYDVHEEIFFWYSAAVSYSLPLAFVFLSLGLFSHYKLCHKSFFLITSCLLGFLSMGGTQGVTGLGCCLGLMFCVYDFLKNKHFEKSSLTLFLVMLAGALLNVTAPGNYARHTVLDYTGLHPFSALKYALMACADRLRFFCFHTDFLAVLMLIVFIGIITGRGKNYSGAYFLTSLALLLLPVITSFPIALGYSRWRFPDRCLFLVDTAIYISSCHTAFAVGVFLVNKRSAADRQISFGLKAAFCVLCLFCVTNSGPQDKISFQILQQLRQGIYQNYHQQCLELFEYLETQKGQDVVLTEEQYPQPISLYYNFGLSSSRGFWINKVVSNYFGINSIAYISEDSNIMENSNSQ